MENTWKRYLKRYGPVLVVFCNKLLWFVSKLSEKDISIKVDLCR